MTTTTIKNTTKSNNINTYYSKREKLRSLYTPEILDQLISNIKSDVDKLYSPKAIESIYLTNDYMIKFNFTTHSDIITKKNVIKDVVKSRIEELFGSEVGYLDTFILGSEITIVI